MTNRGLRNSIASIVRELFPDLFFRGIFSYTLEGIANDRFDATPEREGLPPLRSRPLWPGAAGHTAKPQPGSKLLVAFVNADASRPVVVGFEPLSGSGIGKPVETRLEGSKVILDGTTIEAGSAAATVIRDGDTVQIFTPGMPPTIIAAGVIGITSGTAEVPPAISRLKA
jgi:hypothetical protein